MSVAWLAVCQLAGLIPAETL